MFGIGETELVIIVVFAFLLFGPDKLPGMGRTLGRVLRQFREASDGFTEVVQTNIMDPASEELEKSPKQRKREEAGEVGATEDAQPTDAQEKAEPRRETFAERKARLKAEREAAAAAEDSAADAPAQGPAAPSGQEAANKTEASAKDEKAHASAADLYAISATRKSSRSRVVQQADPEDAGSQGSDAKAPDATASVPAADEAGASAREDTRGEDGDVSA